MRLRNIPGAREMVAESPRCISPESAVKGQWNTVFGRTAPLIIEIGMGKGRFIIDMALKHPEADFVGIERYESVIVKALRKLDRREKAGEAMPGNLRFLCADAADIEKYFSKGEVSSIYLNFSDPWPKDRHAKRRLVYRRFLNLFSEVLKEDGRIEFKTDNAALFDFALSELEPAEWQALYQTYDLHSDPEQMKVNIMTEYEEKFSSQGNKICKYVISKKILR